jgi:hypothetical protein
MTKNLIVETNGPRGLFSHVLQVLSSMHANPGAVIAVDWSNNHAYARKPGENVWDYWFEQPWCKTPAQLREAGAQTLPLQYSFPIFMTPEVRAWAANLCWNRIWFKPEVLLAFHKHVAAVLDQKKKHGIIGVHVRRTDHIADAPYLPDECYFEHIDRNAKDLNLNGVFLASDDARVIETFTARYGDRILTYPAIRSTDGKALHHNKEIDGYRKGMDVLVESLLLANTNLLLKTVSGVTHFSVCWNDLLNYIDIDTHLKRTNA